MRWFQRVVFALACFGAAVASAGTCPAAGQVAGWTAEPGPPYAFPVPTATTAEGMCLNIAHGFGPDWYVVPPLGGVVYGTAGMGCVVRAPDDSAEFEVSAYLGCIDDPGGSSGGGGDPAPSTGVTGTVTLVVPAMTESQVADYLALWSAFLAAAVAVLCVKAIYNKFRVDSHD